LIICAMLFGSMATVWALNPMTYREIAMLVRNGQPQQVILDETNRRKLLQPLSSQEESSLASLGASPAFLQALRAPALVSSKQTAADYQARVQQLKQQQEQLAAAPAVPPPVVKSQPNEPGAKPIDLKFTAVDGSPVDLTKLRGKVVLLDFWATWSEPCMREVPNVVATYQKYHPQGLEIVGISLDSNKATMLRVTQQNQMTWPQYFDGKGQKNEISTAAHIRSIPTLWLINKTGFLVNTKAGGNLDAEVAKLLAE